jgi:ribosome biogenesis GTPase A
VFGVGVARDSVLQAPVVSTQWFPGHMTKARRAIAEAMPSQDVVIEVLDARMPQASANPLLTELRGQKPCLKVLSKSDLADPDVTQRWLRYFEHAESSSLPASQVRAIAITTQKPAETRARIAEMCALLAKPTRGRKTARAMIVGIPNVGKSTLVNTLAQRKITQVGDKPAVTKAQQVVHLTTGLTLSDNPGLLWPNIEDPREGLCLALGGAIADTAIDYEAAAQFGADYLLKSYPHLVQSRYKLEALPSDAVGLLEEIARRRGGLRAGGRLDTHKAADILVHDFRAGALGRVSLEHPPSHAREGV